MSKSIIITDLDGTLLDSVTYSFGEAAAALRLIHVRGVPLVLCSSKTRAEMERVRRCLDNEHPFISENGGGIFIPQGYFQTTIEAEAFNSYQLIALGMPYAEIRRHFIHLRERLATRVRGFADMTVEEVAVLTGLDPDDAVLARQRDFDEPFVFEGEVDERFLREIEASGLRWTRGRMFHIMGKHDKGLAVNILMSLYTQRYGAVTSIGLGDSLNDLPMLRAVNHPVLVCRDDGNFDAGVDFPGLMKAKGAGPRGWNEAVLQLLAMENARNNYNALTEVNEKSGR